MKNVNFADLIKNTSEVKNTHINIGVGKDISIRELADLVKEIVGYEGKVLWDESKPDGASQNLLNVDKLKGFGWHGICIVYSEYKVF